MCCVDSSDSILWFYPKPISNNIGFLRLPIISGSGIIISIVIDLLFTGQGHNDLIVESYELHIISINIFAIVVYIAMKPNVIQLYFNWIKLTNMHWNVYLPQPKETKPLTTPWVFWFVCIVSTFHVLSYFKETKIFIYFTHTMSPNIIGHDIALVRLVATIVR